MSRSGHLLHLLGRLHLHREAVHDARAMREVEPLAHAVDALVEGEPVHRRAVGR